MQNALLLFWSLSMLFPRIFPEEKKENPLIEEKIEVIGKVPLYRAMQSISVLDDDQIRNFSAEGLKGLLNQSPGMLVLNAGNPAQFSYGFARGASVNQMLYLVDGIKLHDPSSSLAGNFSFLSPQLIEKIEIVRGPLSNLYGSSAMGGVVNVITRKKQGLLFDLSGGSHGTLESNIQFGKRLADFFVFFNSNLLNYDDGLKNDHFERRGFSFTSGFAKDSFDLGISFFGTLVDAGIPQYLGMPTPNRKYKQSNFIISMPVNWRVGHSANIDFKWSLHWNNYDFFDPDDVWNYYFSNNSTIAELQAKYSLHFLEKLKLTAGLDLSRQNIENVNNNEILFSGKKTDVSSFFVDLQADLNRFLLAGSLRYDKYDDLSGVYSPQLGGSFNLSHFLKLRTSFSRSFRAPALPERLNPYWGNPALLPETGRSFEIGADLFLNGLIFGLTYFDSAYKNLIGFSPLTTKFANINKAEIKGLEVASDWEITKELNWRTAYTYLHTQDVQYDRALLRRPRHSLSSVLNYKTSRFSLSIEMIYVGKRLDYDELLWSVSESARFNQFAFFLSIPLQKRISIFCRVNNAFNSRFAEVLGYPAPLRRMMLGIKYQAAN